MPSRHQNNLSGFIVRSSRFASFPTPSNNKDMGRRRRRKQSNTKQYQQAGRSLRRIGCASLIPFRVKCGLIVSCLEPARYVTLIAPSCLTTTPHTPTHAYIQQLQAVYHTERLQRKVNGSGTRPTLA